jgi:hypothetical protein
VGGKELKISMVGGIGNGKRSGRKGNGKGKGSGIITLRGNEKWETKNSKYQWWGIGRYKGKRERKRERVREVGNGEGEGFLF